MAKIRIVEVNSNWIALVIDDRTIATWNAPDPGDPFTGEFSLIQQMLNETYEKGREDKQKEIGKTLRDIFGLKGEE